MRKTKYLELSNKNWLYEKYIIQGLSTKEIAEIVGAKTPNSVRQSLLYFKIPIRTISDGLTFNRSNDGFVLNIPVIEGSLLGDAGLKSWNKESDESNPYLYKKNKNYDHVKYFGSRIFQKDYIHRIKENIYSKENDDKFKKDSYSSFLLRTESKRELMNLYRKWYPKNNNYKKVIPEDVDISPESLLHWFMDDGCSTLREGRKSKQVFITMCSESFERDEQQMLCEKIYSQYGLTMNVRKSNSGGTGWRMFIPQSQTGLFYEIIGLCPVPSLEYKWK